MERMEHIRGKILEGEQIVIDPVDGYLASHDHKGRKTFYDYRAGVTIIDTLLTEKPREKRGKSGRPPRIPWLNDPGLRMRVLSGIEMRINSLSVQRHIKATFLAVVGRHLPDSGKKES